MYTKVICATPHGIGARAIEVEVDVAPGLAGCTIVGLADKAVKESRERIRSALQNSGLEFPFRSITINLAPAQIKKEDVLCDLPIAIGILLVTQQLSLSTQYLSETLFLGELSLTGELRPVNNMLTIAHFARRNGYARIIIPQKNVLEASLFTHIEIIGVDSLVSLMQHLTGGKKITPTVSCVITREQSKLRTIESVIGQHEAKRAVLIAAAGYHNVLLTGPPGCGKSLLASCLPSLLPPLSVDELITTSKIHAAAGVLSPGKLITTPPFRSPHHTISPVGLVGGGSNPQPGEISLAHNGILFLDEATEFSRRTLEVLRQPLELQEAVITRAQQTIRFPCRVLCVVAMNPCPCGYAGSQQQLCRCSQMKVEHYQQKLSGPLLDRIDIQVRMHAMSYEQLHAQSIEQQSVTTSQLQQQVIAARASQRERGQPVLNGLLSGNQVAEFCTMESAAQEVLAHAFTTHSMSMRRYHKIIKVARTLADLDQKRDIGPDHISESVLYFLPGSR